MKLSIIIPIFKVEEYIACCLKSIKDQLDEDVEVILVNDGTPDNSMQKAFEVVGNDSHFKVINQENQGLSIARNNGFLLASGEFVWFVDSDDWLLNGAITQVKRVIAMNENIDVIASVLLMSYENSHEDIEYKPINGMISGKLYLQKKYRQGAIQRFIFKRSFLLRNKLQFRANILHEDSLYGFKMLYLAKNIYILPNPVYAYRIRSNGSIMSSISIKTAYDLVEIHKELTAFMNQYVLDVDKKWYRLAIFNTIECIFGFCRYILGTEEFKCFYKNNKKYLFQESKFLLSNKKTFLYGVKMCFFPIWNMRIRVIIKKLIAYVNKKNI